LTSASPEVGSKLPQHPPAGEVVISMRPVSVYANGPDSEIERLRAQLRGPWRQAARAVMVLLSLHELTPAQIAALLECHPGTARRWIARFSDEGLAGLADRPRSGRPRLGGPRLARRIAALLGRPGPWTLPPDPPLPGPPAGQCADLVPAGPAGRDLAAAEADRPRRPVP
jgi:Winged helix-turn helix